MGRHRSRSRSYSPRRSRSPPLRKRYDDPRDRYRGGGGGGFRRSGGPSGLLIRNIALETRMEEIRAEFERFGPVKDVYLPKNYYTGEPRGFGFVKFRYGEDAAAAKQELNHRVIGGREIAIVYADENRKTPHEMRLKARISDRYDGRGPSSRSPRRRHHSYSRSPSPPPRHDSRDRSRRRSSSRSPTPERRGRGTHMAEGSPSPNPGRSPSPGPSPGHSPIPKRSPSEDQRGPSRSRSYSPS